MSSAASPAIDLAVPRSAASVRLAVWERPLVLTFLFALAGALALQLWRPFFFLTDDTLSGTMPVMVECCRKLWSGQWPFTSDAIFGGNLDLLHDLGVFTLLNPIAILFSWLALTNYYYLLPDVIGTADVVVIAMAFAWFACQLRRHLKVEVSTGMIVALSLSYALTPFNFVVGASWIGFLHPQASFPVLVAGLIHPSFRKGTAMIGVALLYALIGSHLHPFIFLLGFSGLFAALLSVQRRTIAPLLRLASGGMLTMLIISPLIMFAFSSFAESDRSAGLSLGATRLFNVPILKLLPSFLFGPLGAFAGEGIPLHMSDRAFNLAIAFSLVNIPFVAVLIQKRSLTGLERSLVILMLLSALCIVRPVWLAGLFSHLPILSGLRWPFREIAVLLFFVHFFFLLNASRLVAPIPRLVAWGLGGFAYAVVFLNAPPSFNELPADRMVLRNGTAVRFWDQMKQGRTERLRVMSAVAFPLTDAAIAEIPFPILGSHNYGALFGITNISGYAPMKSAAKKMRPVYPTGVYSGGQAQFMGVEDPDLLRITLVKLQPTILQVSQGTLDRFFRYDTADGTISEIQSGLSPTETTPIP